MESGASSPTDESMAGGSEAEDNNALPQNAGLIDKAVANVMNAGGSKVDVAVNGAQTMAVDCDDDLKLPEVVQNMVPLKDVVDRMIQSAFAELQNMKSLIPPAPLTTAEVDETVKRLEDVIRTRLLADEVIPLAFRRDMRIDKGCVTFRVDYEYEVTLSVDGVGQSFPWKIVELNVLVKSSSGDYEGLVSLQDYQLRAITEIASQMLLSASKLAEKSDPSQPQPVSAVSERKVWPLVALEDHLKRFCLNFQLEILRSQAEHLARTRWKDHLLVNFVSEPVPTLTLRFWTRTSISGSNGGSEYYLKFSLPSKDEKYEVKDFPQPSRSTISNDVVASNTFLTTGNDNRKIFVSCYKKLASGTETAILDPNTKLPLSLNVESASLDIEKILVHVTECCARTAVRNLQTALLGIDPDNKENTPTPFTKKSHKRKRVDDVYTPFKSSDINIVDQEHSGQDLVSLSNPYIDVSYIAGRMIRLSADIRTGQIVLTEGGAGANLLSLPASVDSQARKGYGGQYDMDKLVKAAEEKVNQDPSKVVDALVHLRYETTMEHVVSLCIYLGLEFVGVPGFLSQTELAKLSPVAANHMTLFRFPAFPDYYLAIAANSKKSWISAANKSNRLEPYLGDKAEEISYRAWIISLSTSSSPVEIRILIPLHAEIVSNEQQWLWSIMDVQTLGLIVSYCRKQIAWCRLLFQLREKKMPYSYVIRGTRILSPKAVDETQIAALDPKIYVFNWAFTSKTKNGADTLMDKTLANRLPYGHLFLSLEETNNETLPDNNPSPNFHSKSYYLTAKVKMITEFLPPIQLQPGRAISYDPMLAVMEFRGNDMDHAIESIIAQWTTVASVAELASQMWARRSWFNAQNVKIVSYSIDSLTLSHSVGLTDQPTAQLIIRSMLLPTARHYKKFLVTYQSQGDSTIMSIDSETDLNLLREQSDKSISGYLEDLLNQCSDAVVFTKAVSRLSLILQLLQEIATRRNDPDHYIGGKPSVYVLPLSINKIRLCYGKHAVDFHVRSSDMIAITDAAHDNVLNKAFQPIPYFSDVSETTLPAQSLVSLLSLSLSDVDESEKAVVLPLPNGFYFSKSLLAAVLKRVERHLEILATFDWIEVKLRAFTPALSQVQPEPNNFRLFFSTALIIAGFVATTNGVWKVVLAPTTEDNDMRPYLKAMLEICLSPHAVLKDLLNISSLERSTATANAYKVEWCFVVPANAPSHLPPAGSPGVVVDENGDRLSLVIRFSKVNSSESQILPIRCNYSSGVIGHWRPDPDPNDFTVLPSGDLLQQRLQEMLREENPYLDRVFLQASAKEVTTEKGGPGKNLDVAIRVPPSPQHHHDPAQATKATEYLPYDCQQLHQSCRYKNSWHEAHLAKNTLDKSGTVFAEFTALAIQHGAVNLGQGFPTLPVPDFIRTAASEAITCYNPLHQYTRSEGHPRFVNALSKFYADKLGRVVNPMTEIVTTVGATEAIYSVIQAFVNPGDEVILMQPFYDSYPASITLAGGVPVIVNLKPPADTPAKTSDDWKLDLNELRAAIKKGKTKMIFVNNPHNPVGKVWTREELEGIAEIAKEFDLLVAADEVYETLVYSDSPTPMIKFASLPGMFERTITIGSIGKMFGVTGWKIGWCIAPEEIIRSIWMIHQFVPFSVVTPLQEAAAVSLEKAMESDFFLKTTAQYEHLRNKLRDLLAESNLAPTLPHGGYFIMADTERLESLLPPISEANPEKRRDYRVCRFLTKEVGVTAIPPSAFYERKPGAGGDVPGKYARFAFCKGEDLLDKAQEQFKAYFGPDAKKPKH
ncbi:Kynurenine--oxoglutarate transaminase 3 [Chytridiales sp. JEL 0842]|nr:Kynurenine--oxoglutarate transaminase 3 [Chytridiales sp. JEL 0842]